MLLTFLRTKIPFLILLSDKALIDNKLLLVLSYTSIIPSFLLFIMYSDYFFVPIIVFLFYMAIPSLVHITKLSIIDIFNDVQKLEHVIKHIGNLNKEFFTNKIFFYLLLGFLGPKHFCNFFIPHIFLLEIFAKLDILKLIVLRYSINPYLISYSSYFILVILFFMFDLVWKIIFVLSGAILFTFWAIFSLNVEFGAKENSLILFFTTLLVGSLVVSITLIYKRKNK
ncbi:hypothetical protein H311_03082 [Anncaliia algerae PRA109]|nr:hypothetical protein H311_03082 [Anncaliia algerae PRA109]